MIELPHDHEAELEVLSALLIDGTLVEILELEASDFHHPAHGMVWEAAQRLRASGEPVDPVLLRDRLKATPVPFAQVHEAMCARCGIAEHAPRYAEIVRRLARRRAMIDASQEIIADAVASDDPDEVLLRAETRLAATGRMGATEIEYSRTRTLEALDEIVAGKLAAPQSARGLLTGYVALDSWTDGLPRKLVLVAARPGMGKSAFALCLALRVARRGHGVYIWSGEMDSSECWGRLIAIESQVPYSGPESLTARQPLSEELLQRAMDATHRIAAMPLALDPSTGRTAPQIVHRARRAASRLEAPLGLLVVDHFHCMRHDRLKGERGDDAMGRSSGVFRDAAKDLRACVLVCAQLNRKSMDRMDKVPRLEDLRECGALEQDAQIVLAPHRPWVYDRKRYAWEADLHAVKNRNGRIGSAPLRFIPPTMTFTEPPV